MVTDSKRSTSFYTFASVGSVATFTFTDGSPDLAIDTAKLAPEITQALVMHGLKQKIVDAAAMSRDPETGKSPLISDKIAAMSQVASRLVSGVWRVVAEGGNGGNAGLLARALTSLYPAKDVKAWLETLDDKQKAALRSNPKVAAEIEKIKLSSTKSSGINSDDLLAQLDEPAVSTSKPKK